MNTIASNARIDIEAAQGLQELTIDEVDAVSGAGFFYELGAALGRFAGSGGAPNYANTDALGNMY